MRGKLFTFRNASRLPSLQPLTEMHFRCSQTSSAAQAKALPQPPQLALEELRSTSQPSPDFWLQSARSPLQLRGPLPPSPLLPAPAPQPVGPPPPAARRPPPPPPGGWSPPPPAVSPPPPGGPPPPPGSPPPLRRSPPPPAPPPAESPPAGTSPAAPPSPRTGSRSPPAPASLAER